MRRVILAGLIIAPIIAVAVWSWSPAAAIGIVALSHALVLYPTLRPNVQWLGPVATRFETDRREIWLTIDDGPTDDTAALVDMLDRRGAKATFFVKGRLAEQRPDLIAEIVRRGHSVANHSYSHPSGTFWCLPPRRVQEEIDDCSAVLTALTGRRPRWFRAPVGMKNPAVHPVLARRGMVLVGWSARGFDANLGDAEGVLARILPRVVPGAVIVLHQGRSWSIGVIERVIEELQTRGYALVIPEEGRLKTKR